MDISCLGHLNVKQEHFGVSRQPSVVTDGLVPHKLMLCDSVRSTVAVSCDEASWLHNQ